MKLRSFGDVVNDICAVYLNDESGTYRTRVGRTLRIVMAELSLHIDTPVKSKVFVMPESFAISMPKECVDVTKVGVLRNNNFVLMGKDQKVYRRKPEPTCACSTTEDTCVACTFHNVSLEGVVDGGGLGEVYANRVDGYANGEYRYDPHQNIVMFSSGSDVSPGAEILIEWKSAVSSESLNLIPEELVNLLGHKVAEKINLAKGRTGQSSMNHQLANKAYSAIVRRWNRFSPEELIAALSGESMSAPKH